MVWKRNGGRDDKFHEGLIPLAENIDRTIEKLGRADRGVPVNKSSDAQKTRMSKQERRARAARLAEEGKLK